MIITNKKQYFFLPILGFSIMFDLDGEIEVVVFEDDVDDDDDDDDEVNWLVVFGSLVILFFKLSLLWAELIGDSLPAIIKFGLTSRYFWLSIWCDGDGDDDEIVTINCYWI